MRPSLTGFMVGLVLVSLMAATFGLFMADLSNNYDIDTSGVNLSKYNKLTEMHSTAEDIKNETVSISQPTGVLDVVGGFFYNAYKVLITIPQSFNLFYDMSNQALIDSNLGVGGEMLRNVLVTIVVLLIFSGVILAILLKTDRL